MFVVTTMKLFACVFLVLVILDEYHCNQDNDSENKLSVGLGFTAKTMISGQSENGHRPSYHPHQRYPQYSPNVLGNRPRYQPDFPHHGYPSYSQTGLGHRPSYQPYYQYSRHPSYRSPYSTNNGRSFGATYNIQLGRKVGAWNGTRQKTPYHRGSYGPQYDRPRFRTMYPTTPLGTANQAPIGAPNGSPNTRRPPNGTPAQTPLETLDGTPQRKLFFVTPNGIRETPA